MCGPAENSEGGQQAHVHHVRRSSSAFHVRLLGCNQCDRVVGGKLRVSVVVGHPARPARQHQRLWWSQSDTQPVRLVLPRRTCYTRWQQNDTAARLHAYQVSSSFIPSTSAKQYALKALCFLVIRPAVRPLTLILRDTIYLVEIFWWNTPQITWVSRLLLKLFFSTEVKSHAYDQTN